MKIKEAFSRLRFTLSKQNKPNQKDIDAFNKIAEIFQKTESDAIQDNILFAKLYTYVLGKLSANYNDVDFANKELNKILSQKIDVLISQLTLELKAMEVRKVFKDDFLKDQNPTDVKKTFEKYPKFNVDFFYCWDFWDEENVTAHLNANINLSIQNFKTIN